MTNSGRWVIGRSPDCDLIVSQGEVSSRHCCLTRTPQGWFLEDLKSSNGTFVNGKRIPPHEPVAITSDDRITLGHLIPMPWPGLPSTPQASGPKRSTPMPPTDPQMPPLPPLPPLGGKPNLQPPAGRILRIGRAPDNDIVLDQPSVSAYHARVVYQGDQPYLEDLNSSNGTFVGSLRNRIERSPLKSGDIIYFSSLRISAARLLGDRSFASTPGLTESIHIDPSRPLLLGRSPDCDQILDYPMISAHHARLSRMGNEFLLEDLQSTNGTFVNGNRITRTHVRPGDVIGLGSFRFVITAAGYLESRDTRGNTTLEARTLAVRAGKKTLISDINLIIFPGEFVGLMGPSGAGKTTLMNALNGYTPPSVGSVLINGQDLYKHYDQFRSILGYVPQEDVMHRDLTVGQALYYCARLRLPTDFSHADIQKRIQTVIEQLHLQGTENVLIGSAEVKGISGGQRRRVNLAMELITDPQILFLDEPTSGLSSEDALTVMKVLRELADKGKTILLTIHQPSLEVYRLMDNLVLLGKDAGSPEPGKLVYFGPAYPDAVYHFNPEGIPGWKPGMEPSPDEILRGLKKRTTEDWQDRYQKSRHCKQFVQERIGTCHEPETGTSTQQSRRISPIFQWWMLVRRQMTIKLRDHVNTAILLVQAPIVALLIVLVFGRRVSETVTDDNWLKVASALGTSLFLMSLAALWFGASNAVREIVGEWAIYHRERMVSLRIGPYVASKFTVLGLLALIQCATLMLIVDLGCGLKADRIWILSMLMMSALVGTAIGLILSAMARTNEVAIALLPIVLLPMVILGGAIQPVHEMHDVPRLISLAIPTRWGYEGLLLLESEKRPKWTPPVLPVLPGEPEPAKEPEQDMAELSFHKDKYRGSPRLSLYVLGGMLVGGLLTVVVILRRRDVH